jgi:SAM-dependent methyltransferase
MDDAMTALVNWDWDLAYREGTPVWETGEPSAELVRFLSEKRVGRGSALDIGCGTGADAIYMVRRGLEVTAVDSSPTAIERARVRAEMEDALPRFVLADFFEFAKTAGTFDFVYDSGFYHYIRQIELERYLDGLWRATRPGSYFLALAAAPGERIDGAPPPVTKRQLYSELGRLFEVVRLDPIRMPSPVLKDGYPAWSCLMQRPVVK